MSTQLNMESESLTPSVLKALLIHVLLALVLVWGWPVAVDGDVHVPNYVKATLISMQPSQEAVSKTATSAKPREVSIPERKEPEVVTAKVSTATTVEAPKTTAVNSQVNQVETKVAEIRTETAAVERVEVKQVPDIAAVEVDSPVRSAIQVSPEPEPEEKPIEAESEPVVESTPVAVEQVEAKPEPVPEVEPEVTETAFVDDEFDIFAEMAREEQQVAEQQAREEQARIDAERMASQQAKQDEEDRQAIGNYKDQIAQQIVARWSRPPNARPDMEVYLTIKLLPTGELLDVEVLKSSGDAGYDASAIRAVKKVKRFEVPTNITLFEKGGFRQFDLKFRPEDLKQ
jgi:colicin import membrane protein